MDKNTTVADAISNMTIGDLETIANDITYGIVVAVGIVVVVMIVVMMFSKPKF